MAIEPKVDGRRRKKRGGPGGVVRVYKETWDALKDYCVATGRKIGDVVDDILWGFLGPGGGDAM